MLGSAHQEASPLLGRLEEQSLLSSLVDDVATRGQALVLRGEPSIGKSRLLSAAERMARERDMTVLVAAGVQSETHLPFAGPKRRDKCGAGALQARPPCKRRRQAPRCRTSRRLVRTTRRRADYPENCPATRRDVP
jgi:hypothetical protein